MQSKARTVRDVLAVATAIAVGFTVSACGSRTETPPPSAGAGEPTASAIAPSTAPVAVPTIPQPTHSSSGLIVDYAGFAKWDTIQIPANPMYEHDREGSQVWLCDKFFEANGLSSPEFNFDLQTWKGEEIVAYIQPRLELAWKLNVDKSEPENGAVAGHLLECLTAGPGSDAYKELSLVFKDARGSRFDMPSPSQDMDKITRENQAMWGDSIYITEYATQDGYGDTIYPKVTYQLTVYTDWRIYAVQDGSHSDDPIDWGPSAPVVLDPARRNAP